MVQPLWKLWCIHFRSSFLWINVKSFSCRTEKQITLMQNNFWRQNLKALNQRFQITARTKSNLQFAFFFSTKKIGAKQAVFQMFLFSYIIIKIILYYTHRFLNSDFFLLFIKFLVNFQVYYKLLKEWNKQNAKMYYPSLQVSFSQHQSGDYNPLENSYQC